MKQQFSMTTTAAIDQMAIWHSKDDKPPKGFEKFFRRPKDGEKKEKSAAKKKEEDSKEKEEDLSDEETETKKGKEGDGENAEEPNKIKSFFFDPNNNPKNEALFLLAALVGAGYFVYNF